jgi:hypothetical protein
MFGILLIYVLAGHVFALCMQWYKEKKAFKFKDNIPSYALSFVMGGIAAFFIKEDLVQGLALVALAFLFVKASKWLLKVRDNA